ncbi:MAG: GxGYxYP family putative glycoside hydrolase, partial [Bacteroidota bacterium]|nr:GxGYxYP family putative glycoside hydrolase [Bacteroidota bacterium]
MKKMTSLKRLSMIAFCFLFLTLQTQKAGTRVKKVLTAKDTIQYIDLTEIFRSNLTNQANIDKEWDDIHSIATLQGIVNRDKPKLYIKIQNSDSYWWGIYRRPGAWLSQAIIRIQPSVIDVISYFKNKINGVVLYDPKVPSTSNVASSIAGIENLMAVRYDTSSNSLYSQVVLNGPKLAVKRRLINEDGTSLFTGKGIIPGTDIASSGSIKNDPYLWFMELYMKAGKCNTEYGAY